MFTAVQAHILCMSTLRSIGLGGSSMWYAVIVDTCFAVFLCAGSYWDYTAVLCFPIMNHGITSRIFLTAEL